jgi:hypothetical protein
VTIARERLVLVDGKILAVAAMRAQLAAALGEGAEKLQESCPVAQSKPLGHARGHCKKSP